VVLSLMRGTAVCRLCSWVFLGPSATDDSMQFHASLYNKVSSLRRNWRRHTWNI